MVHDPFHKSAYSEKVVMNKLIVTALTTLELFLFKGALAQIELTAPTSKKRIGAVSQDSSGWERMSAVGVRLTNRNDKILAGFQSSPISAKLVLGGDISVADDSANGSTTSLSTATGASHLIAGRVGSGSYLPLKFWTNGSIRGTFATNGGFFMEGATGSSMGAGTINATGLYINGVAVGGGGGSPSGWTDGTNIVYVTDVNDSVGVGITSPTAKFHMHLRGTNQASSFKITTPLTGTNPLTDGFDVYYGSLGDHVYITNRETGNVYLRAPAGAVVLNTNGTDRVYVGENGGIFIGITSYDGLTASGDVLADGGVTSVTGSTNASTMGIRAVASNYSGLFADRSDAGGTYLPMAFFTGGSRRASIFTNGDFLVGSPTTSRGKFNIIGDADKEQFVLKEHSTQNDTVFHVASSDNVDRLLLLAGGKFLVGSGESGNYISVRGVGANSERFGKDAKASGSSSLAVGPGAEALTGSNHIAIGKNMVVNHADGSSIGIGADGDINGSASVGVGDGVQGSGFGQVLVGAGTQGSTFDGVKVIAQAGSATANYQFVGGSAIAPSTQVYFGNGVHYTSPTATTINGTSASAGQTDLAGASISIAGGVGTGSANGGDVLLKTSAPGSSGTSQNALTTRLTVKADGGLFTNGAVGGSQGDGTINATGLYVNGVAVGAGGATGWSYSSPVTYLSTSTDNVAIGSSTAYGKLSIKGDTDETQLWVRAHSTQTDTLVRFLTSSGSNIFSLFNTGQLILEGSSSWLSVPGGLLSEKFGKDAQAAGNESVAFGYDARAGSAGGNIAIGRGSRAGDASDGSTVAIGLTSSMTGLQATGVGYNNTSTANYATFLGSGHQGNFSSILIGAGAVTTANNQFIAGSTVNATTNVYFGNGDGFAATSGTAYTIHGSPAGSGQTNQPGGSVTITGGKGTGSGAGGDVIFQTATPGGSGTSQNAYVERMRIQDTGQIEHHNAVAMSIPSGATGPTEINSTGEVGIETNPLNGAFNFYNGSAEVSISPVIIKTWVVTSPTSAENFGAVNFPFAVTVDSIVCVLRGLSTPSVTINFAHGLDRSSGANLLTSGQAITNTTTGQRFGASSFSDATLAKGEFIWLTSSAQSGTVNELSVTMFLRKDAL